MRKKPDNRRISMLRVFRRASRMTRRRLHNGIKTILKQLQSHRKPSCRGKRDPTTPNDSLFNRSLADVYRSCILLAVSLVFTTLCVVKIFFSSFQPAEVVMRAVRDWSVFCELSYMRASEKRKLIKLFLLRSVLCRCQKIRWLFS